MTWRTYEPPSPRSGEERASLPVSVSLNQQGARGTGIFRLKIVVKPELLDGGLAWWKAGASVRLEIGEGDDGGSIRIVPAGAVRLCKSGGKNDRAMLSVPVWPGLSLVAVKSTAVEFDHTDKWIEIRLPAAISPPLRQRGGPAAPAVAPTKAPFVGLGASGPHPHPAMQRPATRGVDPASR